MSKSFWAVIAAIVLVFVGIVTLGSNKTEAPGKSSKNGSSLTQHVLGKGTTGITLIEYGDYQCPYCKQANPVVKQVQAEFNDPIKFQFRHFPLISLHQNAFAAARAAEAAGMQGKFWEMHDLLYENNDPSGQSGWVASNDPITYFDKFAKEIGLDVAKYKKDFASSQVNDLINADVAAGTKLGITGTPTFYLDGKKLETGSDTKAGLQKAIKEAIAKKSAAN